jgi:hypothetical protein
VATQRVDVDHPDAAARALADAADPSQLSLVVTVSTVVPEWLPGLLAQARTAGSDVVVVLDADHEAVTAQGAAGWEIGVLTSVLSLGIDQVEGADPKRVARVQAVVDALDAASRDEAAT